MLAKNIIRIIAPALVAAAIAAPIAQAGPGTSDPAGRTEAKGYLAIANYLATRSPVVAQASDLAGRSEAKGYLGISNYLASQGSTEVAAVQTSSFHWGDAGIGAALAAGLFLLGAAGGLFLRRRRVITRLSH